jgi:hypothetical protein
MPLIDVKGDIKAAQKIRLPWWVVLCIIVGALPIYWIFDRIGKLNIALPTLNCIAVICFIFILKRKLRRHAWFWITMAVIIALHIPLIFYVPWTTRWVPALMISVVDSLDFCLMLWVLSVVEKLMRGPEASEW